MYTPKVTELLLNPNNGAAGPYYNGIGDYSIRVPCRTNPNKITLVEVTFKICVERGIVKLARYEVFGDPIAMATGSFCVLAATQKPYEDLVEACSLEKAVVFLGLKAYPDSHQSCLAVTMAVSQAVNNFTLQLDT